MTRSSPPAPAGTLMIREPPSTGGTLPGTPVAAADAELKRSLELLRAVAAGKIPHRRVVRVSTPPPMVAMSRRESRMPGFEEARRACIAHGFVPVIRHTGGRAVAYDETCVVFDVILREAGGPMDQALFFRDVGDRLVAALRALGVDARLGEVPGEYCPGQFSVNARGAVKLIGTSQRAVRGARLLSGMLPLGPVDRFVQVLVAVNRALGLDWDPVTFGTLGHENPGLPRRAVEDALVAALDE
ncbi:biotin/lipoate A/B protein ligase family protein [Microbacterium sp. NPDC078428]|uniref:biotin/lipoate A/B protein ligase family protein n=1 Tax=Microbacterium sp. NPDC078428 TaxID=3364190 RepID=UPI0037C6395F